MKATTVHLMACWIMVLSASFNGRAQTCVPGSTVEVCATWSGASDPEIVVDFSVEFAVDDYPNILLITGNSDRVVYATYIATGEPAHIKSIIATESENFVVSVMGPDDTPGAITVEVISLEPTGTSNFGNLKDGHLTEALGFAKLKPTTGGVGGAVTGLFIVDGICAGFDIASVDGGQLWLLFVTEFSTAASCSSLRISGAI